MTVYFGKNFKTIVREERPPELPQTRELLRWCLILNNMALIHGTRGEISFRTRDGFAITGKGVRLNRLDPRQVVEVLEYSQMENALYVRGRMEPSEEALTHHAIYQGRPYVGAIFHIHDSTLLNARSELGIPLAPLNSPEGIASALDRNDVIAVRDNGLLFLGPSLEDAGNLIVQKSTEEFRKRLGRTF